MSDDHAHIYVDLIMAFSRRCQVELDGPAMDALYKFISIAVVEGIAAGYDYSRFRDYLACHFEEIAEKVNRAAGSGVATRQDIIDAGYQQVSFPSERCVALVSTLRGPRESPREDAREESLEEKAARANPICRSFSPSRITEPSASALGMQRRGGGGS